MIEFRNVSLSYGKKEILKDVSFTCKKGKITAIIGRNGAGKSTCLRCLIGEKRYLGEILLEGKNIESLSGTQRAQRISYLSQTLPDTPFTVSELASLGRRPYQKGLLNLTRTDKEIIEDALKTAGMSSFSKRPVNTLSGGEKQRAYLSMVFAQDTDVIALDEAATHMDPSFENEMYGMIKRISREKQKTIILVTHNLTHAINEADEIVILDGGTIRAQMDREKAQKANLIEEIFSVQKHFTENGMIVYL